MRISSTSVPCDSHAFPPIRGVLDRLTLTGRGDVDGFILNDGTEVKTAPGLSSQATHRTVSDAGVAAPLDPPAKNPQPPARDSARISAGNVGEIRGQIRMALHGPQGEVDGVLLESGVMLRFPPNPSPQLDSLIRPRESILADGVTLTSSLGTVVDVRQLGTSRDHLIALTPSPPPLNDRKLCGPRDRRFTIHHSQEAFHVS